MNDDPHTDEIKAALAVLGAALLEAISRDEGVGDALIVLATALKPEAPADAAEPLAQTEEELLGAGVSELEPIPAPEEPNPQPTQLEDLSTVSSEPAEDWRQLRIDLELVVRRSRLKAEALDWARRRREVLKGNCDFNIDVKPIDDRLIGEAREMEGCYLWMLRANGKQEAISELSLTELADCYRAVEMVVDLAHSWELEPDQDPEEHVLIALLKLAAEAQSALRTALWNPQVGNDEDQFALYTWVRQQTDRRRVFLERHMDRESCASPSDLVDFPERLGALRERAEQKRRQEKSRQDSINRIEYHIKILEEHLVGGVKPEDESLAHHWRKVFDTASKWVYDGHQVTDIRILASMARVASDVPTAFIDGHVATILEAVERWLDCRSDVTEGESQSDEHERDVDEGPSHVADAIERVQQRHPDRIVLALNNRSDKNYPYARPREVQQALEWLATTVWSMRSGHAAGTDHRKLSRQLRDICGWFYRPRQSATAKGSFPEFYQCTYQGRSHALEEHMGRGNAKRLGPKSIRIAFAWDDPSQRIVIGFLGQHQKTGDS